MGIMFRPPPLTEAQWLSGTPYEEMVNYTIGLGSPRKSVLAKVAQFRLSWNSLDEKCKAAVVTVETHADDRASLSGNLQGSPLSVAMEWLYFHGLLIAA